MSRYDEEYEHAFEFSMAGVSIQAPQVGVSWWVGYEYGGRVNAGSTGGCVLVGRV